MQKREYLNTNILSRMHHVMCREYGFIGIGELRKTPMFMLLTLLERIDEEKEAERKEMERATKSRR